jgi:uncharacterized protein (TIGR02453 family)
MTRLTKPPRFSNQTLHFLKKASRQKRPDWLEKNRDDYERFLLTPLRHLAGHLKINLGPGAPAYHFPQKGIGRLKRPSNRVSEGGGLYKSWISYSVSVPAESRFDHNPNLYFMILPSDPKEGVLVAGGLYMPSSRQTRAIREAIAEDASAFDRLFASKDFARCFPGGFSDEKISSRIPRGFDPNHPRMEWLKLQAFFVWRPYSRKEFSSPRFPELVARDWKQILRLNELLEKALQGRLPKAPMKAKPSRLLDRLSDFEGIQRKMDF